jgi:hypothetical protein
MATPLGSWAPDLDLQPEPEQGYLGGRRMSPIEEGQMFRRAIEEGELAPEDLDARERGILEGLDALGAEEQALDTAGLDYNIVSGFPELAWGAPDQVEDPEFILKGPPPLPDRPPAGGQARAASQQRAVGGGAQKRSQSETTRRSLSGSLYPSVEDEALDINKQIEALRGVIKSEKNALREFDAGTDKGEGFEEDEDVALMRALAQTMKDEPVGPYSNIAAQLAMVQDPNFAGVWDKAANKRINAARKHFSRMGTVSRLSQSDKKGQRAYRARLRSQSDQKLKGYQQELGRLQKHLYSLQKEKRSLGERGKDRANRLASASLSAGFKGSVDAFTTQKKLVGQINQIDREISRLADPSKAVNRALALRIANALGEPIESIDHKKAIEVLLKYKQTFQNQLHAVSGVIGGGATRLGGVVRDLPATGGQGAAAPVTAGEKADARGMFK